MRLEGDRKSSIRLTVDPTRRKLLGESGKFVLEKIVSNSEPEFGCLSTHPTVGVFNYPARE